MEMYAARVACFTSSKGNVISVYRVSALEGRRLVAMDVEDGNSASL